MSRNGNIAKLQDIHGRPTPRRSNPYVSGPARDTTYCDGECREGEEIRNHHSLRVSCVFSLLFTRHLYLMDYSYNHQTTRFSLYRPEFHGDPIASKFFAQSCSVLLEDETHSTRCYRDTTKDKANLRIVALI